MRYQYENIARILLDAHKLDIDATLGLAKHLVWADRAQRAFNEDAYQNELDTIRHFLGIKAEMREKR